MENENIVAVKETEGAGRQASKITLSLIQLIVSLGAILLFLIMKGFFPDHYCRMEDEYRARMFDSVFAEDVIGDQ